MTSNIEETDIPRPVTQDEGDPGADPEAPEPPKPHAIVEAWQTLGELGDVFGEKPPRGRWLLKHGDDGVLPLGFGHADPLCRAGQPGRDQAFCSERSVVERISGRPVRSTRTTGLPLL